MKIRVGGRLTLSSVRGVRCGEHIIPVLQPIEPISYATFRLRPTYGPSLVLVQIYFESRADVSRQLTRRSLLIFRMPTWSGPGPGCDLPGTVAAVRYTG